MTGENALDLLLIGVFAGVYLTACVFQLLTARCVLTVCERCANAERRKK